MLSHHCTYSSYAAVRFTIPDSLRWGGGGTIKGKFLPRGKGGRGSTCPWWPPPPVPPPMKYIVLYTYPYILLFDEYKCHGLKINHRVHCKRNVVL